MHAKVQARDRCAMAVLAHDSCESPAILEFRASRCETSSPFDCGFVFRVAVPEPCQLTNQPVKTKPGPQLGVCTPLLKRHEMMVDLLCSATPTAK